MTLNIIKKVFLGIACVSAFSLGAKAQNTAKHIYAYKNGVVVFRADANAVDSVALEENKTVIGLYKHDNSTAVYKPHTPTLTVFHTQLPPQKRICLT